MKAFTPFWFKPPVQDEAEPDAEFELKPLDQRTLYIVLQDMDQDRGICGVDGAWAAFEYSVTNWRGISVEFSPQAKRQVLKAVGDLKWSIWIAQIAAKLYKSAILGDAELKNS